MDGLTIRSLVEDDAASLFDLRVKSRSFLAPWEPIRSEDFWTLAAQRSEIRAGIVAAREDKRFPFGIFAGDEIVGMVSLSNVVRGAWQNATIGYFVGEPYLGRGYATEAVGLAVTYAFSVAGLHRVQAGVMPRNAASKRVLEKVGFRSEGLSRNYLKINGVWEDHEMFAITVEERSQ